jgi:surfeit locus 1 family protein
MKIQFRVRLIPTILMIIIFFILLSLGFWQLNRADQKKIYLTAFRYNQQSEAMLLADVPHDFGLLRFHKIKLTGHFDNRHQFLLENQVVNRQQGVDVLTPFIPVGSQKIILVNRGWVPLGWQQKIQLKPVNGQTTLVGLLQFYRTKHFVLKEIDYQGWPKRIQKIAAQQIAAKLKKPIYPFYILLSPGQAHGFYRNWTIKTISAEKHQGYAIQWFALAFTLFIIWVLFSIRFSKSRE